MKEFDFNQRKQGLEVTTYANSMWVALSRCGIFQKGERTVGLVLPPGAALDKYYGAVMMLLTKADALRYAVPIVRVSSFRQEADVGEALAALSSAKAVIVLISHAAELPLEVTISLDHIVEVGTFKPYHLLSAARAVTELNITMEQAEVLVDFPPSLLFAAIRHSRPIEVTLQKLAASVTKKQASAWEPRVEELAGYGKATEWALDLAEDISAWRHGTISWSDVDAGLLLSGPPGCGKTLFASAVARSCGVGFLAASSAQWQSRGHLGDMLGAMRKTFRQAIADAPVILFLDEFDSFGSRKLLKGNNASYGLQVINALLELLDGANGREGVVVIAATNRPDDIDEALLRPGRLDRHIAVEMPDREAREQILSAHVGLSLPADDLRAIALATGGYSGAALRQLARDARRVARKQRRPVSGSDFLAIVPPVVTLGKEQRWPVCIHEAGHAVVGLALGVGDVEAIVVAREAGHHDGGAGYVEWRRPVLRNRSLQAYRDEIAMILAGRAAEQAILNECYDGSGGAEGSDLHRASDIATILIAAHGIQSLGFTNLSSARELDELRRTDPVLRRRVERLLADELARAEEIILERRADVVRIAEAVRERELLPGVEVARVIGRGRIASS
ncbi:AAA family ATPase [Ensifer adhaerens]|nr:AAA family ATPase [Ensifer adhaerens]MBZ7924887.1 AAA family ATPase [Ensifer adhaerens]UAX95898.1 AAA family ATPase [Ensifer adhaerens]UAY04760.1 AAA family ATPase [Ensifer adhaerens]UAY10191.1 AAA family ATPase [Ensifer adhaerens]